MDRLAAPPGAEVLGLLELLEVHGVVDVGDDDLVGVDESGGALEEEALEDDDVGPVGVLAQAGAGGGDDLEAVGHDKIGRAHV